MIKTIWRAAFPIPSFANNAKERGTHCVGAARKIKGRVSEKVFSLDIAFYRTRLLADMSSGDCFRRQVAGDLPVEHRHESSPAQGPPPSLFRCVRAFSVI
jgi:hypothetical protein